MQAFNPAQLGLPGADGGGGTRQPAAQHGDVNTEQAQLRHQQQQQPSGEKSSDPEPPALDAQAAPAAICPAAVADPEALSTEEEEDDDDDEFDAELATWLTGKLSRLQPGAELTADSIKVLGRILDDVTQRVLHEARQVGSGDAADETPSTAAAAGPNAADAAWGAVPGQQHERRGRQQHPPLSALTSLDIHKACKRVLREPAGSHSHLLKQAWHLDKQSLKGIKRQKQAAASAAADDGGGSCRSKENNQQQPAVPSP